MIRRKQERAIKIFNKAVEILNNIQGSTIEEDYYTENSKGCRFEYGSLIITYFNKNNPPERVFIEYNGYLVLAYYYNKAKVTSFYPGDWINLVENLHSEFEDLEYYDDEEDEEYYYDPKEEETRRIADEAAEQVLKRFRKSRGL